MATKYFTAGTDGDVATAGNWSGGTEPAENDTVVFDGSNFVTAITSITGTMTNDPISAVVIANTGVTFGADGTPLTWDIGGTGAKTIQDAGTGSRYCAFVDWVEWNIMGSGTVEIAGATSATSVVKVNGSSLTITVGDLEADSMVIYAGAVTTGRDWTDNDNAGAPNLTMYGGTLDTASALGTALCYGGTLTHREGAIAALTLIAAKGYLWSTGTIAALTVKASGQANFTGDLRAKTITQAYLHEGATFLDPTGVVVHTNPPQLVDTDLQRVTINVGRNKKYTIASI